MNPNPPRMIRMEWRDQWGICWHDVPEDYVQAVRLNDAAQAHNDAAIRLRILDALIGQLEELHPSQVRDLAAELAAWVKSDGAA